MARRVAVLVLAALPFLPLPAEALTLRDIVELSKAGLSDEVLLALIEVDRPVFAIDSETLKSLKAQGVSERVLIAVIRSGRTPQPAPAHASPDATAADVTPVAPPQTVVVVEHHEPQVREVPVAVPVYIPVVQRVRRHDGDRRGHVATTNPASAGSPFYYGQVPRPEPKPPEPVYWGWGGKPRPDGWKPAPDGKR